MSSRLFPSFSDALVDFLPFDGGSCDAGQGCRRGSWDPMENNWDHQGGRVYSTSLAVLTLEVYYRYKSERAKVYPVK